MSNGNVRDPKSGKRVLRFVATAALVVAPVSLSACGGAQTGSTGSEEHTNVDHETMNVDHTPEPHTNVAPEEEPEPIE